MRNILPFIVMCVGMFIALLDIQIVASSLAEIGGGLSASQEEISWIQTAYLIAEIVMIPLSGWLTRVLSTRWLFVFSAAGFTLASALCALAWNIQSMIAFRALQGALGASMIPIVFTSSFHYFQGPKRVYSAAAIGTIANLAPTLGPILGGAITSAINWHWLFYINIIPGVLVTLAASALVDIDRPSLSLLRGADYPGIALVALGLGSLEYVLEEGTRLNWFDDTGIRNWAIVSGISLCLFVARSLAHEHPIVDFRALRNRNFAVGCFLSFVTGIGTFTTIYLTPLFLAYVRGFSADEIGGAIFATGVGSLSGVPFYIYLAKRVDTRWLMMFGYASFGLSMLLFSQITSEWGGDQLLLPQLIRGFPTVFVVAPAVTLGLGSLPPERLKYASGLFNMMRNLGGAVGIAASAAVLSRGTKFYFQVLSSRMTPSHLGAMDFLNTVERHLQESMSSDQSRLAALELLRQYLDREASTLAYADAFRLIMVAFLVATFMVPLLRRVDRT